VFEPVVVSLVFCITGPFSWVRSEHVIGRETGTGNWLRSIPGCIVNRPERFLVVNSEETVIFTFSIEASKEVRGRSVCRPDETVSTVRFCFVLVGRTGWRSGKAEILVITQHGVIRCKSVEVRRHSIAAPMADGVLGVVTKVTGTTLVTSQHGVGGVVNVIFVIVSIETRQA